VLPFLKPKLQTGLITEQRKPDGGAAELPEGDHALKAAAEDMIRAFNSKDPEHLALALRSAFQILDSEPQDDDEQQPNEDEEE